ncbi:MAG: GGDEF domain-containing protein [Pseudomonadota bacterium]
MSVIVSGVLAPPSSFILAIYSNRLIRVQEQLHALATTDSLTGLLNRRAFTDAFERETARAARTNAPISIVLLDLDHFKKINNVHGHAGGDIALRNIAERLRTTIRFGTDEIARWGGEEFAIMLTQTNRDSAVRAALRLRSRLQSLNIDFADRSISVTASFGVVECAPGEQLEDAVMRADKCLRQAKRKGRDCVVAYTDKSTKAVVAGPQTAAA